MEPLGTCSYAVYPWKGHCRPEDTGNSITLVFHQSQGYCSRSSVALTAACGEVNSWYKGLSLAWVPLKQAGRYLFSRHQQHLPLLCLFLHPGIRGQGKSSMVSEGNNQRGHSFEATVSCFPFPSSELFFSVSIFKKDLVSHIFNK